MLYIIQLWLQFFFFVKKQALRVTTTVMLIWISFIFTFWNSNKWLSIFWRSFRITRKHGPELTVFSNDHTTHNQRSVDRKLVDLGTTECPLKQFPADYQSFNLYWHTKYFIILFQYLPIRNENGNFINNDNSSSLFESLKSLFRLAGKSFRQKVEAVSRMQPLSSFGKIIINSMRSVQLYDTL